MEKDITSTRLYRTLRKMPQAQDHIVHGLWWREDMRKEKRAVQHICIVSEVWSNRNKAAILSDWHRFCKPVGSWVWVEKVRVWVVFCIPKHNPYLPQGFCGFAMGTLWVQNSTALTNTKKYQYGDSNFYPKKPCTLSPTWQYLNTTLICTNHCRPHCLLLYLCSNFPCVPVQVTKSSPASPTISMPLPRASAPNQPDSDIVERPWKHCPPAYFAENGDPLAARKKARHVLGKHTKVKSVSTEEEAQEASLTSQPLRRPLSIPADQDIHGDSDGHSHSSTPVRVDSDTTPGEDSEWEDEPQEEDDITKLSLSSPPIFMSC